MENTVQPLTVPQSNPMVYNPNYSQQMQYQHNAPHQYYHHHPPLPVQKIPLTTSGPPVTGPPVTGPPVTGPEVAGPQVTGPEVAAPPAYTLSQQTDQHEGTKGTESVAVDQNKETCVHETNQFENITNDE